jgi:hypothetical protein
MPAATHRKKLVIAPAPAAATASCPSESSCVLGCPLYHLIAFCSSLYDMNKDAFSAIAPTIGAGNPYNTHTHT